jgi:hypothetical protein
MQENLFNNEAEDDSLNPQPSSLLPLRDKDLDPELCGSARTM